MKHRIHNPPASTPILSLKARDSSVNATDHAYAELKRRINCNDLPAGKSFLQDELAGLLNISRTPAREALIRLAEEGLVEIRPRHGIMIRRFSIDELAGIYEVLTMLEAQAARRLADRGAAPDGFALMLLAHRTMEKAFENRELAAWIDADEAFHKLLVSECGNEPLRKIVHGLWDRMRRVRHVTRPLRTLSPASNRDHANILQAIRRRDGQQAFDVHFDHRTRSAGNMLDLLSRNNLLDV